MVMTITGLPMQAAWVVWGPRIAGVLVLLLLGGAVWIVLRGRTRPATGPDVSGLKTRRERLLDELVALELSGDDPARREQLVVELERVWD